MRIWGKKVFLFAIFLVFSTAGLANSAQQVLELLSPLKTLKARFSQQIIAKNGEIVQQAHGWLRVEKPGKFRWELDEDPSHQLLIINKDKIWFYDADLAQVIIYKRTNLHNLSPAMLLSDSPDYLSKHFTIHLIRPYPLTYRFTPKQNHHLFHSIELIFSHKKPTSIRLIDNLGMVTLIKFLNLEVNKPITAKWFTFKPDKTMEIIYQ